MQLRRAKVETVNWYDPQQRYRSQQLRPESPTSAVWNTRLGEREFRLSWDLTDYR